MKTRDFFRLIIKLFALYSLIQIVFYYIPYNASSLFYDVGATTIMWFFAVILFGVGVLLGLIKKVDAIIDWLKLDQGFEEERIDLGSFDHDRLLSLVIIVIGGLLIVDYFPDFIHNCYLSFRRVAHTKGMGDFFYRDVKYFDWTISLMNLIIGYLFIMNHHVISKWLSKRSDSGVGVSDE